MIGIRKYHEYWQEMVNRIAALKSSHLVATEEQLKKKISQITDDVFMVVVVPSAKGEGEDTDNMKDMNTTLLFVLFPMSQSDMTDENYLDNMEITQNVIKEVRRYMCNDAAEKDDGCHEVMAGLDIGSISIDPEFNYLGAHGWSMSFQFKTLFY